MVDGQDQARCETYRFLNSVSSQRASSAFGCANFGPAYAAAPRLGRAGFQVMLCLGRP